MSLISQQVQASNVSALAIAVNAAAVSSGMGEDFVEDSSLSYNITHAFQSGGLFQDASGTTAVAAVGDPIGRVENIATMAAVSTVVYSSDFSAGVDGFTDSRGTSAGNIDGIGGLDDWLRFTLDTNTGQHNTSKAGILSPGALYSITYTYYLPSTNSNVDGLRFITGASPGTGPTETTTDAATTVTISSLYATTADLTLSFLDGGATSYQDAGGDDVIYIRDITVTQLTEGSPAIQTTAGSRPVLGIQPKAGVRNRLTYTEQLDNSVWVKVRSTVSANADGIYDKLTEDSAGNSHHLQVSGQEIELGETYTWSIDGKPDDYDWFQLSFGGNGFDEANVWANFDLVNGVVGNVGSGCSASIEVSPHDSNAYRCSLTATADETHTAGGVIIALTDNADAASRLPAYTGDGASGVLFARGQLEKASSPSAYQRVTAWYDVTEGTVTANNHVYFAAPDGVDDYLTIPGSASAFKFLHDGTGGYVSSAVQFGIVDDPDAYLGFLSSAEGAGQVGTIISFDDRSSVPRNERLEVVVYDGTGKEVDLLTSDGECTVNLPVVLDWYYDSAKSPECDTRLNKTSVLSGNGAGSPSSAASNKDVELLRFSSSFLMSGKMFSLLTFDGVPSDLVIQHAAEYHAQKAGITL